MRDRTRSDVGKRSVVTFVVDRDRSITFSAREVHLRGLDTLLKEAGIELPLHRSLIVRADPLRRWLSSSTAWPASKLKITGKKWLSSHLPEAEGVEMIVGTLERIT